MQNMLTCASRGMLSSCRYASGEGHNTFVMYTLSHTRLRHPHVHVGIQHTADGVAAHYCVVCRIPVLAGKPNPSDGVRIGFETAFERSGLSDKRSGVLYSFWKRYGASFP